MPHWRETELKLGLPDETAWRWVRDHIGPNQVLEQANHFFDTESRALRGLRIGVRLRSVGSRVRLTVKGDAPQSDTPAITRRIELERDSSPDELQQTVRSGLDLGHSIEAWRDIVPTDPSEAQELEDFISRLTEATTAPLRRFGGFVNQRTTGHLRLRDDQGPLEVEIELDRSRFSADRTDYEIEVERSSESGGRLDRTHHALVAWLDREGKIRSFAVESKLARLEQVLAAGNRDDSDVRD